MRCAVVAADFRTSDEVVLQEGRVKDAVLASAAIPVIFPPVSLGGRLLVDGALSRNTPISTAVWSSTRDRRDGATSHQRALRGHFTTA